MAGDRLQVPLHVAAERAKEAMIEGTLCPFMSRAQLVQTPGGPVSVVVQAPCHRTCRAFLHEGPGGCGMIPLRTVAEVAACMAQP